MEKVLLPDIEYLFPNSMVIVFEHFCYYVKGKHPAISVEIDQYLNVVKSAIDECYIERCHGVI